MKTKEEITQVIADKLYGKHYSLLAFSDLASRINALGAIGKAKLMDAVLEGRDAEVGEFLRNEMVELAKTNALTEATNMLQDDTLTLAEMQEFF